MDILEKIEKELDIRVNEAYLSGADITNEDILFESETLKKLKSGFISAVRKVKNFVKNHKLVTFIVLAAFLYKLYGMKAKKTIEDAGGDTSKLQKSAARLIILNKPKMDQVKDDEVLSRPELFKIIGNSIIDEKEMSQELKGFSNDKLQKWGMDIIDEISAVEGSKDEVLVRYRKVLSKNLRKISAQDRKVFNEKFIKYVVQKVKKAHEKGQYVVDVKDKKAYSQNDLYHPYKLVDRYWGFILKATRIFAKKANLNTDEKMHLLTKLRVHYFNLLAKEGLVDSPKGESPKDFDHAVEVMTDIINLRTKERLGRDLSPDEINKLSADIKFFSGSGK
jgi:hypothetical protein